MRGDNYLDVPENDWDDLYVDHQEETKSSDELLEEANQEINSLCAEILDIVQAAGWCPAYSHPRGAIGIVEDLRKERDKYHAALQDIMGILAPSEDSSVMVRSNAARILAHLALSTNPSEDGKYIVDMRDNGA